MAGHPRPADGLVEKNMSESRRRYPIGVFDSGLGGLTVVKALMKCLPCENIVYFGDTARVPYGTKSREAIIRFSKQNVRVLLKYKVKMVVVACNSSSSHALSALKKTFDLPITGVIDAGVRKAVQATRNRKIGVIATPATINSGAYEHKILLADHRLRVVNQACPLLVPLVEEGWFQKKVTEMVAREYLEPFRKSGVDTLILGCTHYPLLKTVFRRALGPGVTLIDSAEEVALEVRDFLCKIGCEKTGKAKGRHRFLVSDTPSHFGRTAARFLGFEIKNVRRAALPSV